MGGGRAFWDTSPHPLLRSTVLGEAEGGTGLSSEIKGQTFLHFGCRGLVLLRGGWAAGTGLGALDLPLERYPRWAPQAVCAPNPRVPISQISPWKTAFMGFVFLRERIGHSPCA